jgi:hypothetical protein
VIKLTIAIGKLDVMEQGPIALAIRLLIGEKTYELKFKAWSAELWIHRRGEITDSGWCIGK